MKRRDVCYGMLRAAACVDESDHHALMYEEVVSQDRERGRASLDLRLRRGFPRTK